jgi:protoporphyrinogen IX oxidase
MLIEWFTPVFKALHISTIALWAVGLIMLPLLFRGYRPQMSDTAYIRFRQLTHYSYIRFLTPSAVLAVATGIVLILLRGIFEPWLLAKLGLVSLLAVLHAYVGHMIVQTAETRGRVQLPSPMVVLAPVLLVLSGILVLVLAKPPLAVEWPSWMTEPQSLSVPRWVPI